MMPAVFGRIAAITPCPVPSKVGDRLIYAVGRVGSALE